MELASLVLYSTDADRTARFYRAVGLALENEDHDDGLVHFAVEVGSVHFAIYPAESDGRAPWHRVSGSTFPGFYVESLDVTSSALGEIQAAVRSGHERMPWGCRMIFEDPDGRPVEINQHEHCT